VTKTDNTCLLRFFRRRRRTHLYKPTQPLARFPTTKRTETTAAALKNGRQLLAALSYYGSVEPSTSPSENIAAG